MQWDKVEAKRRTGAQWARFGAAACVASMMAASAAWAGTVTNYHVTPADLASGKPEFSGPHGTGTNPMGYDWDSRIPEGSSAMGGAPGYGDSSFYGEVDSSSGDVTDRYLAFRVGPRDLFGGDITIGDVASISYWTNDPDTAVPSWHLGVYTATGTGSDGASWYGSRLQAQTTDVLSESYDANTWQQWSTSAGTNQLQFYDSTQTGFNAADLSWSDLAGGDVTRNGETHDFSGETIQYINFQLGYANGPDWIGASYLDGIRIELTNGDVANINLSVVPVPPAALAGLLGMGALAAARKLRRRR